MRKILLVSVIVSSLFATGCGGDWSWGWGTSTKAEETEEAKTERLAKEKEDKDRVLKELKDELKTEFDRLQKEVATSTIRVEPIKLDIQVHGGQKIEPTAAPPQPEQIKEGPKAPITKKEPEKKPEILELWKDKVLQAPHGSQSIESFYWANKDRFTLRGGKDAKSASIYLDDAPVKGDESDKSAIIALIPVRSEIRKLAEEISPDKISKASPEDVKKWTTLRALEYRLLSAGVRKAEEAGSQDLLSQLRTEAVNSKMDALLLFGIVLDSKEGEHQAALRESMAALLTEMRAIDQKAKE